MPQNRPLAEKLLELRRQIAAIPSGDLAARTGARLVAGEGGEMCLALPLWDRGVQVTRPGGLVLAADGGEARDDVQALVLYYLLTADGAPLAGDWVGFSSLPNAAFYQKAYEGYSGVLLTQTFGEDEAGFAAAAQRAGGTRTDFGDLAYRFPVLPHLALLAAFWRGDEDFPASYKVLFDAAASHQLPTDVLAIVGGMLARKVIKERRTAE